MQIVDIAGLTPAQMDSVTGIYRAAFEAPWEMPAAELAAFARDRAGDNLLGRAVALVDGETPVGLTLSTYLAQSNLLHLKYLAVDLARRNQGLGTILLRDTAATGERIAQAAGRAGCAGVLLEVELPDSPPSAADRTFRRRRIAFYERHGALHTAVLFPRPPDTPAERPDWEVMLLPGLAWGRVLSGPTRRGLGRALLVAGYGADPRADWLAAYLDAIAPPA